MKVFEKLTILLTGLFLPLFALADGPGGMGDGMMDGFMMPGMGVGRLLMVVFCLLLLVLLVLAILALIKYLRN